MNMVRQGATFSQDIDISGDNESGFTVTIDVMQYPGDTPSISRALTYTGGTFPMTITSAETSALDVGQWFIYVTSSDSDEDLREPIKLYISKGWT
ncbi:MAG: hypothetical protein GY941_16580 [Planctomycetes bacterium]|nr:hypothetical protein [Planctomycetota bacterium]